VIIIPIIVTITNTPPTAIPIISAVPKLEPLVDDIMKV
jgi:hypothetical protein